MVRINRIEITEDNSDQVLSELERAVERALEIIGMKIETYAKARCPVGTVESTGKKGYRGGTLRNSITHEVDKSEKIVTVGSNVEYAPYVELGTGHYFQTPPEWEQFTTSRGGGGGHGYVKPRPYLKPAIEDHKDEFERIIRSELGD
jgi:HK97 gp10 family phage protein